MIKLDIRSDDDDVRRQREVVAIRVLSYFEGRLPDLKLLCLLDDVDWEFLKSPDCAGKANRGVFIRTRDGVRIWPEWQGWPDYLKELVCVVDSESCKPNYVFDCLIYVHGRTCATGVGLTMTLAHEIQHFCQYGSQRKLWAANTLLSNLPKMASVRITPWELPFEQDARIASKSAAEHLCGKEIVREYIDTKVGDAFGESERGDWRFVQQLTTPLPYDLFVETRRTLQRFAEYRPELRSIIEQLQDDVDFRGFDLDEFC